MQKDTPNEQYLKLNKELAYETIVTPKGKPHATAIILLADIINQYKLKLIPTENSQKVIVSELNDGLIADYKSLEKKLNYNYGVVKEAIKILEKYKLLTKKQFYPNINSKGSYTRIYLNLTTLKNFLRTEKNY